MALIKNNIAKLKESDAWSFLLFALFRTREIPEYTSLSELIYILDKDCLLKLCEYFGGQTISIPTITELEEMIYGLLLYELIDVDKLSEEEALKKLPENTLNKKQLQQAYIKIKEVLTAYEFNVRGSIS